MLNKRVEETLAREYQFAPVRYKHVVLIDEFYSGGSGSEKIRVTKDKNTGQIIETLAKRRVADLEITSPKRKIDWRISVNIEQPITPPQGHLMFTREKDRVTYEHQHFKIDLTQVTPSDQPEKVHELEVEFAHPRELRRLMELRGNGGPEQYGYDQLIAVFVNNCRILAKNAQ